MESRYESKYTEHELETLYNLIISRDETVATIFEDFKDEFDLKRQIREYKEYGFNLREGGKKSLNDRIDEFYTILFGNLNRLPLHINEKFNEAILYRLKLGK